jgi:glycosyltransferase involved in cell wall biosynthesis
MGERFLTGKADMNIAVSESNRRIGLEKLGRTFRCEVINNGVDLALYGGGAAGQDMRGWKAERGAGIRKEFGLSDQHILISFVARFIHDKNPIALIKAFGRLQQEYPDSRLMLVGDGPAREDAIRLVAAMGLADRVLLPGFRRDVPEILAASDIFCLPSIKEGLPVSLIEAMAMGNAVIATDVQGCVDVVTDGKDGMLVSLDQLEEGLAGALRLLLVSAVMRADLAAHARETVEKRFDAAGMARRIESLYLKTLENA